MDIEYTVDERECVTYDDLIAAHEAYLEKQAAKRAGLWMEYMEMDQ